jgi:uncharacterized RDD family membrane protein YckC
MTARAPRLPASRLPASRMPAPHPPSADPIPLDPVPLAPVTHISVSLIPKEARPFQGRRAGIASRLIAAVLDGLVLAVVLAGIYCSCAAAVFLWNPSGFSLPAPSRLVVLVVGYLVLTAYLTLCWLISGRTYGYQVMGLRVVGRRGGPMRPTTALVRAVFCALVPLGLFWTAVSRQNRSLADLLLRTSVVYDWRTEPSPADAGGGGGATGA